MSLYEVANVDVVSPTLFLYQFHLSSDQVPPVLKSELGKNVNYVHYISSFDTVHFQSIE